MIISFVIPSFNSVEWLAHAVSSVLDQKKVDCEIVIVNDGSTDTTDKYLAWLEKEHPTKVVIPPFMGNQGRSKARNYGNSYATGDIICVLDADDYAHPLRAYNTLAKMDKGIEFMYGSAEVMDALGKTMGILSADVFIYEKMLKSLLLENRIVHSTVAYTKEIANKFPYSDGEISDLGIDDWDQQIRVYRAGVKIDFTASVLTAYRLLSGAISRTRDQAKVLEAKRRILEPVHA